MKKAIVTFAVGTFSVIVISFVFFHKIYYPPLPFDSISKKDVLEKVTDSDKQLVKLINENGIQWYITSEQNISSVDEMIKELVAQKGWVFNLKEGSGLVFEKQRKKLVVTTEKWTGDYVLCQIPSKFCY